MSLVEQGMDLYMKRMSKEQKRAMMGPMMDKFFDGMTKEERKEMMSAMMPGMMTKMSEGMSKEEKNEMTGAMMKQFFAGMTKEEKAEMMSTMMPGMMKEMFDGMTPADVRGMMSPMMQGMMSTMMPGMMWGNPAGATAQGETKQEDRAVAEKKPGQMRERFMSTVSEETAPEEVEMPGCSCCEEMRPWECCPCREACSKVFAAGAARPL